MTLLLDLDRGLDAPGFEHLSALWGRRAHLGRGGKDRAEEPKLSVTTIEFAAAGMDAVKRAVDDVEHRLSALPDPPRVVRVRNYLASGIG
ncbi:MAG TPA: hypothetical protein VHX15_21350 [Frankiaceae bacterium]|nr:hypothetical protein [Frankiaceae bacterium]